MRDSPTLRRDAHHAGLSGSLAGKQSDAEQCHGNVELASAKRLLEGFIAPKS